MDPKGVLLRTRRFHGLDASPRKSLGKMAPDFKSGPSRCIDDLPHRAPPIEQTQDFSRLSLDFGIGFSTLCISEDMAFALDFDRKGSPLIQHAQAVHQHLLDGEGRLLDHGFSVPGWGKMEGPGRPTHHLEQCFLGQTRHHLLKNHLVETIVLKPQVGQRPSRSPTLCHRPVEVRSQQQSRADQAFSESRKLEFAHRRSGKNGTLLKHDTDISILMFEFQESRLALLPNQLEDIRNPEIFQFPVKYSRHIKASAGSRTRPARKPGRTRRAARKKKSG